MRRLAIAMLAAMPLGAVAAGATFDIRVLTPETALKAALAAQKACRARDFQVTVAVVDRMGVAQVMLRDRFAGPHTPDMATAKAWTAVSFRTNTTELAQASERGPMSGIRHRPGVATVGGGLMVQAGGSLLGGIGVSGAPSGAEDDKCAQAGIDAIRLDIEL